MKESPDGEEISLEEAMFTFKLQGWLKIWSEKLEDYMILARNASMTIPGNDKIPRYILKEIESLKDVDIDDLKILHEAKKVFDGEISKPDKKRKKPDKKRKKEEEYV